MKSSVLAVLTAGLMMAEPAGAAAVSDAQAHPGPSVRAALSRALLIGVLFAAGRLAGNPASTLSLDGPWRLQYCPATGAAPRSPTEIAGAGLESVPAIVPGNVELDLLRAGRISDPEKGNHVYALRKYEAYEWWYSRSFEAPHLAPGQTAELVFDGLDTFGTVWVNGKLAGKADDMLIEQRFDITSLLHPGADNRIEVLIEPAVAQAQKHFVGDVGSRSDARQEYAYVRKAPHMYGWDIMPRLISAGLWRSVHLDVLGPARLEEAYWMTNRVDLRGRKAQILLDWQFVTDRPTVDGLVLRASLSRGGREVFRTSVPVVSNCGRTAVDLENADFWWPRGYGEPALYDAAVELLDERGRILDADRQKIGVRTVELERTETLSASGAGQFLFKVNGEPIFIRGTNWVPLDALHSRDLAHLPQVFPLVTDLNCNLLRCWGGNVYESDAFFRLCDENGILVWQDFVFACTEYPQDPAFAATVRKEAIAVVRRLRGHASLLLWSGSNEDDVSAGWDFGRRAPDPGLDVISREVLPRVIWEYDPLRPYLPSSPYVASPAAEQSNSLPEAHQWGPRGYYKAPFYTQTQAHFVSEIGYHGCPDRTSLERMFDPNFVYPWTTGGQWNDEWQTKATRAFPQSQTEAKRNDFMVKQAAALFGTVSRDLDTFIFESQATQAEALKSFIEFWRMGKFERTGIIWWNLRDGWPIVSDGVVDFYGGRKLAYRYIKRVQEDACVMVGDAAGGSHPVVAVNDTLEEKRGHVAIRDADSGRVLFSADFVIPKNGKTIVGEVPEESGQAMWAIDYSLGGRHFANHYLAGRPPFRLSDYRRWFGKLGLGRP